MPNRYYLIDYIFTGCQFIVLSFSFCVYIFPASRIPDTPDAAVGTGSIRASHISHCRK